MSRSDIPDISLIDQFGLSRRETRAGGGYSSIVGRVCAHMRLSIPAKDGGRTQLVFDDFTDEAYDQAGNIIPLEVPLSRQSDVRVALNFTEGECYGLDGEDLIHVHGPNPPVNKHFAGFTVRPAVGFDYRR